MQILAILVLSLLLLSSLSTLLKTYHPIYRWQPIKIWKQDEQMTSVPKVHGRKYRRNSKLIGIFIWEPPYKQINMCASRWSDCWRSYLDPTILTFRRPFQHLFFSKNNRSCKKKYLFIFIVWFDQGLVPHFINLVSNRPEFHKICTS